VIKSSPVEIECEHEDLVEQDRLDIRKGMRTCAWDRMLFRHCGRELGWHLAGFLNAHRRAMECRRLSLAVLVK
jgi:hypothetical protein